MRGTPFDKHRYINRLRLKDTENRLPDTAVIPDSIRALICCHSPATRLRLRQRLGGSS